MHYASPCSIAHARCHLPVWLEHRQRRQPASSGLLLAGLRAPPIRRLDINGPPAGVHSRRQVAGRLLLLLPPEVACSQTKCCLMCLAEWYRISTHRALR